jgi:hypothetical protein
VGCDFLDLPFYFSFAGLFCYWRLLQSCLGLIYAFDQSSSGFVRRRGCFVGVICAVRRLVPEYWAGNGAAFRCPEMHEHAPDGAHTIYFSNTFSICPIFFSTLPAFCSALPSACK